MSLEDLGTFGAPAAHHISTKTAPTARPAPTAHQLRTVPLPNEHQPAAILASRNYEARVNWRVEREILDQLEQYADQIGYKPADVFKTAIHHFLSKTA